mgnify:CR=1 FL=1
MKNEEMNSIINTDDKEIKLAAKAAYATAKKAGNSASIYGMYQPKEPKTLKKSR